MDPKTAALIRNAAWRAFACGFVAAILAGTIVAQFWKGSLALFRSGVVMGLSIGLGIAIGGTILNIVVGLIDQTKSDITGA